MTIKEKLIVFIVCGKSPTTAHGGGYSEVAKTLEHNLKKNKIDTQIISTNSSITALPLLPIFSIYFAIKIFLIYRKKTPDKIIIWGIGPWALAGIFLKPFLNKTLVLTSYFTSIKHETYGALKAVNVSDYGILVKTKYLVVFYILTPILSVFERITLKFADLIITNYKSTEDILVAEFGISKKKFYRTGICVSKINTSQQKVKLPRKYILVLCRQDARKGINYFLHSIKILKDKKYNIPAIIIGDGEMLEANTRLAQKLQLGKSVSFLGYIHNSHEFLANCSIFCLPSVEEGSGALVVNEAMSLGIPIVSTKVDGISEDLKDNYSALLVSPNNPKALAAALERLMSDPKLAERLGTNGKKEFKKKQSSKIAMSEFASLLSRIKG